MSTATLAPYVPLLPQGASTAEWLAARRTGIGGSDVAAVVGISKYAGPTRVYYDKLGVLGDQDNAAMEWGRRLEDAVRGKFADEHPEFHVRVGPGLVAHADRRWQLATIDGLAAEHTDGDAVALVEVKTGSRNTDEWGDEDTDEVPLNYVCQTTWYMDVFGLPVAYLAVLLDGRDYREYVIEYDPVLAEKLRGHCAAFWHHHVLAQVPPLADALADTGDLLASLHTPAKDSKADLPDDVVGWARIYGNAHLDELAAAARKQEAGNQLRAAFIAAGSPHHGYVDGRKVASFALVGAEPKRVFDTEAFAAAHPDLHARFLMTAPAAPQRRLTVSKEFTNP